MQKRKETNTETNKKGDDGEGKGVDGRWWRPFIYSQRRSQQTGHIIFTFTHIITSSKSTNRGPGGN